ncbi:MAG: hypothetical protein JWO07_668 [Candidatus Saccharibacteria bacterium]|nr:hypothetical protein [Candidatus Saccharibacteria bacterium]
MGAISNIIYSDDFNRASLGSNWTSRLAPVTALDTIIVNSNAMGVSGSNNYAFAQYSLDMPQDNIKITITIGPDTVSADYYLIGLRGNGTEVVFAYCPPGSTPVIYSNTAAGGDWRNLISSQVTRATGPANITYVAGDQVSFEARGNVYTIRRNGAIIAKWNDSGAAIWGAYIDSSHRQWGIGLGTTGTTTRGMIDSVVVTPLDVPPPPPVSDDFGIAYSRIDLSDNWTSWINTVYTTAGRATMDYSLFNWSVASYNWPMISDNHKITGICVLPDQNFAMSMYVRSNNAQQIFAYISDTGNTTAIYAQTNTWANPGGSTLATSSTIDWVDGDTATLEVVGNAYVLRKNGVAQLVYYDSNGTTWGANVNAAHREVGINFINNSSTASGWNSIAATDLSSAYFLPSRMTKSGTLAWQTSATWADITTWVAQNDVSFSSLLVSNSLTVLTSKASTTLAASVPFTGSTATRQHTIRIMRTRTTAGVADTTVVATGSIVTAAAGTCTASVTQAVLEGETYSVQMNSDGASAGTITDVTPTFSIN